MAHTTDGEQKTLKELYKPKDIATLVVVIPIAVSCAIFLAFLMTSR